MKILTLKQKLHQTRRAIYQKKRSKRLSNKLKPTQIVNNKILKSSKTKIRDLKTYLKKDSLKSNPIRRRFIRTFYSLKKYQGAPVSKKLVGQLGLEHDIDSFVQFSSSIIDFNSSSLFLQFENTDRIWPSAITMFVSLVEWVKLTSSNGVRISSTNSIKQDVNDYLSHSGFYDYVQRKHNGQRGFYPEDEVVKIAQETTPKNTKVRHSQIYELVKSHSNFTNDELERFDCIVLSEIFANVTEHGVAANVSGWFVLGQLHKTTGIISICIADNGIGIKNSLITGFQKDEIEKITTNDSDAEYIKVALKEFVSGALDSVEIESKYYGLQKSVPIGKKRGKGLKHIVNACKLLRIRLTICSHYGCVSLNEHGVIDYDTTLNNRCFAGTLYHLKIPARKTLEE